MQSSLHRVGCAFALSLLVGCYSAPATCDTSCDSTTAGTSAGSGASSGTAMGSSGSTGSTSTSSSTSSTSTSSTSTSSTSTSSTSTSTTTSGATASSSSTGTSTVGSSTSSTSSTGTSGEAFAITSFDAQPAQVVVGAGSQLSWTFRGTPTALTLSSDNSNFPTTDVLGQSSLAVTPVRRQTFTLSGTDGVSSDARSITVVARGLTLFAGSPSGAAGSADGQGSSATFDVPTFGAFDAKGNLYVSDSSGEVIRKIDPSGQVSTVAGTPGVRGYQNGPGASARFDYPTGIVADPAGNLYISEVGNSTIRKIDTSGTVSLLAGTPGTAGYVDGAGAQAQFRNPNALVLDAQGNLYLADTYNAAIRKIDPQGNVSTIASSLDGFSCPDGMAIDSAGNIYVTDVCNDDVRKIDPLGHVTRIAGGQAGSNDGPALSASFNFPSCVAVDAAGMVYIADTNNFTIRRLDLAGNVTTFAGHVGNNQVQLGPMPGGLSNIYGLSLSPAGDLYVLTANQVLVITAP